MAGAVVRMFASPQNLHIEILTLKGDDINRWELWEVMRS